ncbi:DKNYY domain-containing protein, partial [Candidatus Vampirococcus lugosii]|nr:membrane protein [Candidatus Vampirococcus lugosii]
EEIGKIEKENVEIGQIEKNKEEGEFEEEKKNENLKEINENEEDEENIEDNEKIESSEKENQEEKEIEEKKEEKQVFEINKEETGENSFHITGKVNKDFEEIKVIWTDYNGDTSDSYTLDSYEPEKGTFEYNIKVDFENINIQENTYTFIGVKEDGEEIREELIIDVGGEMEKYCMKAFGGYCYRRDLIYVYFDLEKIEGSDLETFKIISQEEDDFLLFNYAKDKYNVYYKGENIEGADIDSFEYLENQYFRDKNNVYYKGEIIELTDSETFQIIDCYNYGIGNSCYWKNGNNIYVGFNEVKGIDLDSFEYINYGYIKDKNNIYYKGEIIEGVDSKTFEILGCFDMGIEGISCYSRDKNNIYYRGKKIIGSDPETFEVLGNGYARDKNTYYKYGKKIDEKYTGGYHERNGYLYYNEEVVKIPWNEDPEDVKEGESIVWTDPNRFEYIGNAYGIDEYYVYYRGNPIKTSDVDTFGRIDSSNYFKDKNNVYYIGEIEGADPETFEVFECFINPCYAKDKHHVYYEGEAIKIPWNEDSENIQEGYSVVWTDPREFEYLGLGLGRDENHIYYNGIPSRALEPDKVNKNDIYVRLNFLPGTKIYRENDLFVYHGRDKIIGSDPETFEIFKEDSDYAKDKYNVYYEGKIQEDKDPETFEP